MRATTTFFLFLLQVCFVLMKAQDAGYRVFDNINPGTGASSINCILQDHQGLIWVGSNKGLYSYDGYHFQAHYAFDEKSNTQIYCGVEVGGHLLYLGADNGVLIYNLHTDTYEKSAIEFPRDVRAMQLQNNQLWLGTLNGLFRLNLNNNQLTQYSAEKYPNLPHRAIYAIEAAPDNDLYIGTYNGLCRYSNNNDDFQTITLPFTAKKSNQFINSLLNDTIRHCLWVGMEGGLLRYDPANNIILPVAELDQQSVKSLALDGHGNLLVGTDNGLYVHQENRPIQHVMHDSRNATSLTNNIIWTVFADRDHNIWLGTDYGISLSRHNRALQYTTLAEFTNSGEGNQLYSIFKDSRGYFWFGGTHGLIRATKSAAGWSNAIWYNMGDKNHPLPHGRIRHIYEDRSANLWIATDGSINLYNYQSGQFRQFSITDSTGRNNANWAYNIFEDDAGQLWIATCLGGIFVVEKQCLLNSPSGTCVANYNYNTDNGLAGMFINQIVPDDQGNVWVLLYNHGINKIDAATRRVEKLDLVSRGKPISPTYMLSDTKGMIWLGFRGGAMRIDSKTNAAQTVYFDEFSPNEVLAMTHADGKVWVSTTDGLWLVDQNTLAAQRLNLTDRRFFSLYFDQNEGILYLGDVNGFAITSPNAIAQKPTERSIIATALSVNGHQVNINQQSIRHTKQIVLPHDGNNLALDITDLPYHLEEKSQFVYRLSPLEERWSLLDTKTNRISYTNLSHGEYVLIVSKLDAAGRPSDQQYTLQIIIRPPWYYTVWAKSAYGLLILSLVVWIINFFRVKNRLKIERIEKEKIMEQSRMKLDFLSNLSHELKTPLSMILAPISKLIPEVKNQHEKEQLRLVQQNAIKMNSVIHKILDFNRIDTNSNTLLIRSHIELVSFSRHIFAAFKGSGGNKQLTFNFASNIDKLYLELDAVKTESILDNLLSNAVKYTPEGGSITLSILFDRNTQQVTINISDTGIGIPEKEIPYVFQRFYQSSLTAGKKEGTGIGLYLVKSYVEMHGGQVAITSNEGVGTTITITLQTTEPGAQALDSNTMSDNTLDDSQKPLILIVDDTQEITSFISSILHQQYRCLVANNGKEGLEMCLQHQPDLIISDVMMPEMDGLQMCRQIRKHLPTSTIPIILLTAMNDKGTELESIQLNIDAFVAKPFEPAILISRIDQLIRKHLQVQEKVRLEALAEPKGIEALSYDEKFLASITQIIEDHLSDPELNVSALGDISGINSKQIYRKIKQLTGKTPVEYIKSVRMKKAAMLLRQQKFSVAEVMYLVGFSNHSYFAKCFKEEFDKTPAQYKEEQPG